MRARSSRREGPSVKLLTLSTAVLWGALAPGTVNYRPTEGRAAVSANAQTNQSFKESHNSANETAVSPNRKVAGTAIAAARYRIDAARSQFMVRAFSGGLLFF